MPSFSSNCKVTNDLLIIVKTSTAAADHVDAVVGWIAKNVSQLFPVPSLSYPHPAVCGTLRSDCINPDGTVSNELLVAVHQSNECSGTGSYFHNSVFDGTVVEFERNHPVPILDAKAVSERLADSAAVPDAVEEVGVSAVSPQFLKEIWSEICSESRSFMDGAGKGPMMHKMWMWNERSGLHDIREMSFSFGWD